MKAPPVPGTALHALLQNGTFPFQDPYVDDNLRTIPDISKAGKAYYTFIFVSAVDSASVCPSGSPSASGRIVLSLAQASYRVSAYMDGQAAPLSLVGGGQEAVGMFQRFLFDLGPAPAFCALSSHGLSFLISPPDHPGIPTADCPKNLTVGSCGQGGDHELAQDVVSQDLGGWDWVQASPDRNTGILDAAALLYLPGGVLLQDGAVGVVSAFQPSTAAPSTPPPTSTVHVVMRAALQNVDPPAGGVLGVVQFTLCNASVSVNVSVARGVGGWVEVQSPEFVLHEVELWWPHTLGAPVLHSASAQFFPAAAPGVAMATLQWQAGLRQVASLVDEELGGRAIFVNGVRVFITGGNWIGTDLLSRAAWRTEARYATEVRLHAEMGMNTMRLWGGHAGHPDALFREADRQGMLLFTEFMMSGDNNGRWGGSYSFPLDHQLYLRAVEDTVRRLRGHPSILLWCGGNELFPFNASPPTDILAGIKDALARLDVAASPFIQSTMGSDERHNFSGFDPYLALAPTDGPYGILEPRGFFTRNPGKHNTTQRVAFQPEIGSAGHPEWPSLARFLSPGVREALPGFRCSHVHPVWEWHALEGFGDDLGGDAAYQFAPFSPPNSTSGAWNSTEYTWAAQLAQYMQYQALFEGFSEYLFTFYTAVIMWKSAGPWPALRGALYDFYTAPSAGYYGVRAALEGGAPLHVQLSRQWTQESARVTLVNRGLASGPEGLMLSIAAFDLLSGGCLGSTELGPLPSVPAGAAVQVAGSQLQWPPSATPNATLLWRLRYGNASTSEYLLSTARNNASHAPQDYSQLVATRHARPLLPLAISSATGTADPAAGLTVALGVALQGGSAGVAIAVSCILLDASSAVTAETGFVDARVLPTFASRGYFALIPGEVAPITINAPQLFHLSATLQVQCVGYNTLDATASVGGGRGGN